jgi:hypothetical protein
MSEADRDSKIASAEGVTQGGELLRCIPQKEIGESLG